MSSTSLRPGLLLLRPYLFRRRSKSWYIGKNKTLSQICSYCCPCRFHYTHLCGSMRICFFHCGITNSDEVIGSKKGKATKYFLRPNVKKPTVKIWAGMTVEDLAKTTDRDIEHIFEAISLTPNFIKNIKRKSVLEDTKMIYSICKLLGYRGEIIPNPALRAIKVEEQSKTAIKRPPSDPKDLVKRPPVVTIMGHVDHGKTTLLDTLRNTSVAQHEHGGITQHIGAFTVKVDENEKVTFLDTPGHAAFSAMRARGANATDIVVLVVAADDGVMEQTVESIRYAREANVPIIVAVNKMDKPKLDLEHVKSGLVTQGLEIEDVGGDVQVVYISALKGLNLDQLIEAILVQAEVMEINGDPTGLVEGVVLESSTTYSQGKVATVLVQRGTLKKGALLVAGTAWAKVRIMLDEFGKNVVQASPGTPVQVFGWKELPSAGEEILELQSQKDVKEVIAWRERQEIEGKQIADLPAIQKKMEDHLAVYKPQLEERLKSRTRKRYYKMRPVERPKEYVEDDHPKLSVVIKGDVDGSVEAILDVISTYGSHESCKLDVLHYDVGPVTQNDIELAEAFNGIVYMFNVAPLSGIQEMAEKKSVPLIGFQVIYKLVDDLKNQLSERLPLADKEEILGEANVLQQFMVSEGKKKVPVAGCKCVKGILKKGTKFRVVRNGEQIHDGPLASMKHLKDEVDVIKKEVECGLRLEDRTVTFHPGDIMICYTINKVPQRTNWQPPGF